MQRALRPIVNEMRVGFASLKRDITNLNKTVRSLSEGLEEHKNQTTTELADLHTSMDTELNFTTVEDKLDTKLNELDSELALVCDRMGEEFQSLGEKHQPTQFQTCVTECY